MAWFSWKGRSKDDVFKLSERKIYSYFNGKEMIKADPLALYKKVAEVGPSLSIDIKVAKSPSKDATKAHNSLIQQIREIFDVPSFKDGGLTEAELQALLDHFLTYCEGVKKNSKMFTTSLPNSEESKTTSEEDRIIPPSLDSGSTAKEDSTAVPEKSPMEPQSPLASSTPT